MSRSWCGGGGGTPLPPARWCLPSPAFPPSPYPSTATPWGDVSIPRRHAARIMCSDSGSGWGVEVLPPTAHRPRWRRMRGEMMGGAYGRFSDYPSPSMPRVYVSLGCNSPRWRRMRGVMMGGAYDRFSDYPFPSMPRVYVSLGSTSPLARSLARSPLARSLSDCHTPKHWCHCCLLARSLSARSLAL